MCRSEPRGQPVYPDRNPLYGFEEIMTVDGAKFLPCGRQYIDDDDIEAVVEVLRGDWLTTGPAVHKFETLFSRTVDADYVASCSSGAAARHLACMALGLGPQDRVIVPAISFIATANAAAYCGADIIFADVDPDTGLLTAENVLNSIKGLTRKELKSVKAIVPVNLFGQVAEIEAIREIADQYGWKLIIDSCHALGATYRTRAGQSQTVGDCHFSDMEVFSFSPMNVMTLGEGGAVTTNDELIYDRLCLLRNQGMQRDPEKWVRECDGKIPPPWYYEMQLLGYNYRQSDIHSALGLSQLKKLPGFIAQRDRLAAKYDALLAGVSPHIRPLERVENCSAVRRLYPALIDFEALGEDRTIFINQLAVRNVGAQVYYMPAYSHPFYVGNYGPISRPGAERFYQRILCLPLHASMTEDDVVHVVDQIRDILGMLAARGKKVASS